MHKMVHGIIGLAAVLGIGGCASMDYVQGTHVRDDQIKQFTKGRTKKDQVVAMLGGPQDMKLEGGKQILIYKYQRIAANPLAQNEGRDTTFIFNNKGVLEDIMKSAGTSLPNPLTGR